MSNEKNLAIWSQVDTTDPVHTKSAKKGAYTFTSITPISQFKKATEVFGPQGLGWGVEIGSEVFQEQAYGTTIILSYDAILFYMFNGEKGRLNIHASEKSCYQTQGANGYMKIDDEVRKKVVTNAKTKGLSELGFNADVFMGQFDDPNYVDYRNYEESIEKAENRQEEINQKVVELKQWCKKEIAVYGSLKDERTLGLVLGQHLEKLKGRCGLLKIDFELYKASFTAAHNEQLSKIKPKVKNNV